MNRIKSLTTNIVLIVLLFSLGAAQALAQENDWPRTVAFDEGLVTIYAPQIEALDGDVLYYRAALAFRPRSDVDSEGAGEAEPIFGAGWFKAPIVIDEDEGIVRPDRLELTQTRFPDGTADIQAELASAMARQSSGWSLDFTVTELEAALEAAQAESLAAQKIKTAPPKIIYRDRPALLVTIDGDPVLREIEDSPYEAVINTPFPLITDGKDYFLNAATGVWYRADSATGPYRFDANPPGDIVQMVEAAAATEGDDAAEAPTEAQAEQVTAATAPEIVVSTEPAELIVTEGPADFVPLVDDLLVLQNSDDDVFMHVDTQEYYIVLAGRWYTAPSLEGPWEYQASDALPADFANIPDDSAQADSRVYVAGTQEAEEAVLDAHVPQTARVERGEVDIDVAYDGDPEFEPVEGAETLQYARNTGATVLNDDRVYYLLEDGVWYVASSPHGPWVVSDHRPGELETVAPNSPVYHTKYVYVYDATPEVVYVGYTPGYLGSYVYSNTIVYGTGWHYRPWVSSHYYYPRPRTWGFHAGYNEWSGWSFGLSWYWPHYSYGLNYYYGGYWHHGHPWHNRYWGYWGPHGYRYRPHHYSGYRHKRYAYHGRGHRDYGRYGRHDRYDRWDRDYDRHDRDRYSDHGRGDGRFGRERHRNLYRDDRQRARVADSRDVWNTDPDWRNDPKPGRGDRARIVDNRKVRQASTGPVSAADLRTKAQVRDVNRAASREPMVADNRGEVYRARVGNGPRNQRPEPRSEGLKKPSRAADRGTAGQNRIRQSRPEPISQRELQARAVQRDKRAQSRPEPVSQRQAPAHAPGRSSQSTKIRPSRTEPISQRQPRTRSAPDTKIRQSRTEPVTSQRPVATRTAPNRAERRATPPSREVKQRPSRTQPTRQISAPARPVQAQPSRPISVPDRQERRAAPTRQVRPQVRREPSPPQSSRAPTRSRQAAPVQRAPQQRAPRSAPQRSAPQRSAPTRQSQPSRGQARKESKARSQDAPRGKPRERQRRN